MTESTTTNESLGVALPRRMSEIRDIYIPAYLEIGPAGGFAVAMMRADLDRAQKAIMEGDVVEMLRVYESLKGYKL